MRICCMPSSPAAPGRKSCALSFPPDRCNRLVAAGFGDDFDVFHGCSTRMADVGGVSPRFSIAHFVGVQRVRVERHSAIGSATIGTAVPRNVRSNEGFDERGRRRSQVISEDAASVPEKPMRLPPPESTAKRLLSLCASSSLMRQRNNASHITIFSRPSYSPQSCACRLVTKPSK